MEEFYKVRLVLNEHALPCALESQGILGLCKVSGVCEEGVSAIQIHHSGALDVDVYDRLSLEGVGLARSVDCVYSVDGGEERDSCEALKDVSVDGEELAVE